MNQITFFAKEKRFKKLKVGDMNRRKIVISMLENHIPISIKQLSIKSEVPYTDTHDNVKSFVKSGLATSILVAQHTSRKDSKYELTDGGKLMALAVSVDEHRIIGDRTLDLQKIFQPERGSDAMTYFIRSVLLNCVSNGLQRYVLEFVRNLLESAEISHEPNVWKLAQNGVNEAKSSELQALNKSVLQALSSLDPSQKDTVIQYYRTKATSLLFDISMRSHDSSLQELARMTSRDPDGVYMKFECKNKRCGYLQESLYLKMEEIIVKVFSGGFPCPKCRRLISDSKSYSKKGFRDKTLSVQQTNS